MNEIFDISQTLQDGLAVWPGDPEFRLEQVMRIEDGDLTNVMAVHMGTHTGTHVDAPLHVNGAGSDVASLPLENLLGPARVLDMQSERGICASDLSRLDLRGVQRLLFKTRCSSLTGSALEKNFACIEPDAAEYLAAKGILLVGTDAPSVDPFDSRNLPAHKVLLGNGIVILEGARLNGVPAGDYILACLPLRIAGADGSPARAVLWKF